MSSATLLLCHRLPFPPNKGDKIRSFALLKHLASRGPVHLACFLDDAADLRYCEEVRRIAGGKCLFVEVGPAARKWRSVKAFLFGQPITTAVFSSRTMARWVKDILASERPDNTVIFGSAMAPYMLGDAVGSRHSLFDMVDVDSDKWRQYSQSAKGLLRMIYAREARAVLALEREAVHAFGTTLLVSEFEADTFRQLAPECAEKINASSNGVDLKYFSPGTFTNPFRSDQLAIVMTGRMDYRANVDGALWFAREVAPLICAKLPRAHFYVVGSNPPAVLRRLNAPNMTVTGAVDDIRPYIQSAAAVVAPLLIARGVQNKVLEAMAMQKPVVATHEATRALAVETGVQLWIENDPARFAAAVIAAIEGPMRYKVMENARRYVEEHHDWDQIFDGLDRELGRLTRASASNDTVNLSNSARSFAVEIGGVKA